MTAFGKLIRTTAFRLTLAYMLLFALFAASLLGYFAWNTRRLITEQITTTVNGEFSELENLFARRGLRGLVFAIENRALRPGANLYLITTPTGQAVAGNVGALAPGIMATTEAAAKILAIDGCPLNCAKHCLEQAGFTKYDHLQLADLGMEKGKTPPTPETIAKAAAAGAAKLRC